MSIAVMCGPKRADGARIAGSFMCNEKCYLWKKCCAELGIPPNYREQAKKKHLENEIAEILNDLMV